jgi:predicted RNA-binding protein YlxR (DUF448 family)
MGCGRKAHKSELLRFVVDQEGKLLFDPGQEAPGRGGYFCPREACFDRAAKKRRISVRFRRDVRVDMHSLKKNVQEQLGGGGSGWPR